jgi:hypothetical protein
MTDLLIHGLTCTSTPTNAKSNLSKEARNSETFVMRGGFFDAKRQTTPNEGSVVNKTA